ncbi:hypothetical protein GQ43DRAFT_312506 [Delitschia confertaspora ATCC 74209]|uniref:Uncharacterized protein n=1 Tax=Delitschia confertaspora ATCC 74209 TaxID=1513339 RepID=A0A9P4MZZ4_9PLEO|nr:hypothetical protein GQ43DRAFT_312506 [Delitschia confertaspora ATCC 74209]
MPPARPILNYLQPLARPSSSATKSLLPTQQCRHESTTRRHKKLLYIPQTPSYTPSAGPAPEIVYNPPSASPNIYHTPLKFLPQNDKRRALYTAHAQSALHSQLRTRTSAIATTGTALSAGGALPDRPGRSLPQAVRQPYEKKYNVTPEQIEEIRRLRKEDPEKWTRVRLAEKFGCSQFFVGLVAPNGGKAERVERVHQGI